jgi:hypothetical protein
MAGRDGGTGALIEPRNMGWKFNRLARRAGHPIGSAPTSEGKIINRLSHRNSDGFPRYTTGLLAISSAHLIHGIVGKCQKIIPSQYVIHRLCKRGKTSGNLGRPTDRSGFHQRNSGGKLSSDRLESEIAAPACPGFCPSYQVVANSATTVVSDSR